MSLFLTNQIREIALAIGFNDIRFIAAKPLLESENKFIEWRSKGYAADMNYLLKENPINARPQALLSEARTIIMLSANYYSPCPPKPDSDYGRIAAYAVGLDYHKILKQKIQLLINHPELQNAFAKSKFFTDAVPLLEKSFAKQSGLGFRGKNTLLISKETGSFNFIAEILTDLDLNNSELEKWESKSVIARSSEAATRQSSQVLDGCAKCTRCLDICPTNALPNPYQLDARKCISYQTIENRGEIPIEMYSGIGDWLFGCDLCQTICPYNRNKLPKTFDEFKPESGFGHWLQLNEILDLESGAYKKSELTDKLLSHKFIDPKALNTIQKILKQSDILTDEILDQIFQIKFARTPLLRSKRLGLIRNAKIVSSNISPPNRIHQA